MLKQPSDRRIKTLIVLMSVFLVVSLTAAAACSNAGIKTALMGSASGNSVQDDTVCASSCDNFVNDSS